MSKHIVERILKNIGHAVKTQQSHMGQQYMTAIQAQKDRFTETLRGEEKSSGTVRFCSEKVHKDTHVLLKRRV